MNFVIVFSVEIAVADEDKIIIILISFVTYCHIFDIMYQNQI